MIGLKDLTKALAVACAATGLSVGAAAADSHLPGTGKTVIIGQDSIDSENFQTLLVMKALETLGYTIGGVKNAKYPALHLAVASGDVTLMADHWTPLHNAFYDKAGGAKKLYLKGKLIPNCAQGYLIDKKTADQYGMTNMAQLKDPKIAKLFDADGDGKADLAGCPPGWGCERVIEHHMDAYGLRPTVTHKQGEYTAVIAGHHHPVQRRQVDPVLHLDAVLGVRRAGSGQGRDLDGGAVLLAARQPDRRHHPAERQELRLRGQPPGHHGQSRMG